MNNPKSIRSPRLPAGAAKQTPFAPETRRVLRARRQRRRPDRPCSSRVASASRPQADNPAPPTSTRTRRRRWTPMPRHRLKRPIRRWQPPPVVTPPPVAPEAAGTEYVVVKGDTLGKIAKKNGVTLKALEEANPGVVPTKLKIGQKLSIPGATSAAAVCADATGSTGDGRWRRNFIPSNPATR